MRENPKSMFNFFRNLFVFTLLVGLILAEIFVNTDNLQPNAANSQHQLTNQEQTALIELLKSSEEFAPPEVEETSDFLDFDIPNPGEILRDAQYSSGLVYRSLTPNQDSTIQPTDDYTPTPQTPEEILDSLLPPQGSALYIAYQEGGKAWYYEGSNVLVIYPDETIRSFNKYTGEPTTWLQKEIAYPPVDNSDAIINYRSNYNAEIVAQTSTWVLMKFPSGGFIKVAKATYQAPEALPDILPGYENM